MQYWLDHDEDAIKARYCETKDKERQAEIPQFDVVALKELGYTDKDIEKINEGRRR
jgi:Holliday junction resolvasome RuvABC DNA-binding subunit